MVVAPTRTAEPASPPTPAGLSVCAGRASADSDCPGCLVCLPPSYGSHDDLPERNDAYVETDDGLSEARWRWEAMSDA